MKDQVLGSERAHALRLLAAALVVLLLGAGCGFSDPDGPTAASGQSSSASTPGPSSISPRRSMGPPRPAMPIQPSRPQEPLPPEVSLALIRARQAEATEEYTPAPGRGPQRKGGDPPGTKHDRTVHFHSVNPARDNVARYTDTGVQIAHSVSGSRPIEMRLQRWGRPGALSETTARAPGLTESTALKPSEDAKKQIEYVHEHGLSEWYLNGPHGLEQGFTLTEKPAGTGPLTFDVAIAGEGVTLALGKQPNTVEFHTSPQVIVGQYGDLFAEDADGKLIAASLTLVDGGVRIMVDDDGAQYPLVVDPTVWVLEAKLVDVRASPEDYFAQAAFGTSVAVDGDTLVVGAPGMEEQQGAAYVFRRVDGQWSTPQYLTAVLPDGTPDVREEGQFGASVAVSGDTIAIGSPGGGAAYVFVWQTDHWEVQRKLTAQLPDGSVDPDAGDYFGSAVAVDDGVVVVGSPDDDDSRAAAYAFSPTGRLQVRLGANPVEGTLDEYIPNFARSVAIAGDTLVLGAPDAEAAYVFTRSVAAWEFKEKVTPRLPGGGDHEQEGFQFGRSVALDESTLVVSNYDSAFVFVLADGQWAVQTRLTANLFDATSLSSFFGACVALESDRIVIGSVDSNEQRASAYLFERSASDWLPLRKFDTSTNSGPPVVALSSDTLVVADPTDSSFEANAGVARVFEKDADTPQVLNANQPNIFPADMRSYGNAVALDGNTFVVGNPVDLVENYNSGSAAVFVREGPLWRFQQRLIPQRPNGEPYPYPSEGFGKTVAISGDTIVVGAPGRWDSAGSVFVFVRDGSSWVMTDELSQSPPGEYSLFFGRALALTGDLLVVGSMSLDEPYGWSSGQTYVFEHIDSQWTFRQQLAPELADGVVDQYPPDEFGEAVAVSGTSIVVGAPAPSDPGTVYTFEHSEVGWTVQQELSAPLVDGTSDNQKDGFGSHLALSGEVLAIAEDSPGSPVFMFMRSNGRWSLQQTLQPDPMVTDSVFMGTGVALSGGLLAVGQIDPSLKTSVAVFMDRQGAWTVIETFASNPLWSEIGIAATSDTVAVGGGDTAFIYRALQTVSAGGACQSNVQCKGGPCLGGICCEGTCDDPCRSCSQALTGEADGTCAPLPAETLCGEAPLSCASSHSYALAPRCDKQGACMPRSAKCAGGYACVSNPLGGACVSECLTHDHCVESYWCDPSGACQPDHSGGDECSFDEQCLSNDCANGTCRKRVGEQCTLDAECAQDTTCVDGYCCNSPCGEQCEACDIKGLEGQCNAVEGAPHGERTQCRSTDATCAGRCDGQSRDGCSYPGTAKSCGEPYCSEAVAYPQVCDGTGSCAPGTRDGCAPFGCNEDRTACAKKCQQDAQCAAGAACDRDSGECVFTDATCADSYTVELADSTTHFCEGHRCVGAGACQETCGNDRDCHPDFVCTEGKCSVAPADPTDSEEDSSGDSGETSERGCGCSVPGRGAPRGAGWLLMSLLIALRRTRRGPPEPGKKEDPCKKYLHASGRSL